MQSFTFRAPPTIIFGRDTLIQLPDEIKKYGMNALIVTGRQALRKAGITARVEELLRSNDISYILFEDVEPEPSVETIDRGLNLARKQAIPNMIVVGIGGGSVLDVAKAIAGMIPQSVSSVRELIGRPLSRPGSPFIALPTTAGTGSEVTKNSVITDNKRNVKESILRDPLLIARVAIVDPVLTVSMPPSITADSGIDALTQAIECVVSRSTNELTKALALEAVKVIGKYLPRAYKDGNDFEARERMAFGSLTSALAFSNGGLGAVHGLAHPIGYLHKVPHGRLCAMLLPHIMEFNREVVLEQYAFIGELLVPEARNEPKENKVSTGIQYIKNLLRTFHIPLKLSEIGISKKDIPPIVKSTRGSSLNNNPRKVTPELLAELLESAL